MKIFSTKEEIALLDMLKDRCIFDGGMSRIVYELDEETKERIGIKDPRPMVAKVALGEGGFSQHREEVNCYLEHGDYLPLADIVAAGRYVSIMEEVEPANWRDMAAYCGPDSDPEVQVENYFEYEYECETDEERTMLEPKARMAANVIIALSGVFGVTADNGQLGMNSKGQLVAYDYGFMSDVETDEQTSALAEIYDDELITYYIECMIDALLEMQDIETKLSEYLYENDNLKRSIGQAEYDALEEFDYEPKHRYYDEDTDDCGDDYDGVDVDDEEEE